MTRTYGSPHTPSRPVNQGGNGIPPTHDPYSSQYIGVPPRENTTRDIVARTGFSLENEVDIMNALAESGDER